MRRLCAAISTSPSPGNFEGKNILNVPEEPEVVAEALSITVEQLEAVIARARARLFEAREKRVKPGP